MSIQKVTNVKQRSGIVTSTGVLLPLFEYRNSLVIQNLGVDPLYVKFGDNCSTTDFDFILAPGQNNDDGFGAIFSEDTTSWSGVITVDGLTVRCTATAI